MTHIPEPSASLFRQPREQLLRKSNFALRLQPSLLDEARKIAETEGVALILDDIAFALITVQQEASALYRQMDALGTCSDMARQA